MTRNKLKKWRKMLGYDLKTMAHALECNERHYSRVERGICPMTKDKKKLWGRLYDEFISKTLGG